MAQPGANHGSGCSWDRWHNVALLLSLLAANPVHRSRAAHFESHDQVGGASTERSPRVSPPAMTFHCRADIPRSPVHRLSIERGRKGNGCQAHAAHQESYPLCRTGWRSVLETIWRLTDQNKLFLRVSLAEASDLSKR